MGSIIDPRCLSFQIFPHSVLETARSYRFDEKVKGDPIEHQRLYEELKVEASLLVIVRISILPILPARVRSLPSYP